MAYEPRQKPKFESLNAAKQVEDLPSRIKMLYNATDKAGNFYKAFHHALFSYISNRVPEISDEIYRVDDGMRAGFGWEIGAFESWDAIGVEKTVAAMKTEGLTVAPWVDEMLANGNKTFYKVEDGKRLAYDPASKTYKALPGGEAFIVMKNFAGKTVWKNSACRTYDLGNDVLGLE